MAEILPLKLVDLGSGQGELSEFEPGDTLPQSLVPALAGKLDATGTAADSSKLGGQVPGYYATQQGVNQLASDYSNLSASLQTLDSQIDFTIIYPNGGSAANPANVSANTRYVEAHPFPGFHCMCEVEIFEAGKWLQTGWIYSDSLGSFGVAAYIYDGSLIVQTGNARLTGGSAVSGNPRGDNVNPVFGPAPCRVKVWKVKGAAA